MYGDGMFNSFNVGSKYEVCIKYHVAVDLPPGLAMTLLCRAMIAVKPLQFTIVLVRCMNSGTMEVIGQLFPCVCNSPGSWIRISTV